MLRHNSSVIHVPCIQEDVKCSHCCSLMSEWHNACMKYKRTQLTAIGNCDTTVLHSAVHRNNHCYHLNAHSCTEARAVGALPFFRDHTYTCTHNCHNNNAELYTRAYSSRLCKIKYKNPLKVNAWNAKPRQRSPTQLNSTGHYGRRCWHLLCPHLYIWLNKNFVTLKLFIIGFRFRSTQL